MALSLSRGCFALILTVAACQHAGHAPDAKSTLLTDAAPAEAGAPKEMRDAETAKVDETDPASYTPLEREVFVA